MKIRVFALAKELGLDSKELIDQCNQAGIKVKSSALASITPEEKDIVLSFLKENSSSAKASASQEPPAPTRDDHRDSGGKVRAIPASKKQPPISRRKTTPAVKTTDESIDEESVVDELPETETETETETPQPEAETQAPDDKVEIKNGPTPVSRDDYIPGAAGAGNRMREMKPREMKPRGTVPDSSSAQSRRPKTKEKQALPNIAAPPSYSPPKPKKDKSSKEAPAQKPDIPLTADLLEQQSPLRARLQEKKRSEDQGGGRDSAKRTGTGKPTPSPTTEDRPVRRDKPKRRKVTQDDLGGGSYRGRPRRRRQKRQTPIVLKTSAVVELPVTLRGFSEAVGRPIKQLMSYLFQQGQMITINDTIPEETCLELGMEFGVDLKFKRDRDFEQELAEAMVGDDSEENFVERPPIITILGHVDHGKTSLLDKLRSGNVAEGEAGGITQHIAAYQVDHQGRKLTFVDTPGHAAFGEMRARGANVTDIVVLVVAADDGVMPQTVECISHAKAAGVPIVVAMNKIDIPDADEQKVLQGLANHDILPAEWGGDVEVVRTSAMTGQGLDDLLETLLLTAELQEFKADPKRDVVGVCLEAFMDEGRGPLAWVIVQKGTLKIGDFALCGQSFGRIRAIYDDQNREIEEAGPSTPVKVAGLDIVPGAGNRFFVVSDIEDARRTAESRRHRGRTEGLAGGSLPRTLDDILAAARSGETQDLPLIVKADTPGSLEALRSEIEKFDHPEVRVQIVHEGVGGVNESDVSLADASGAIVIAFHVVPEDRAQQLAENNGVDIRRFSIIYEVTETIKRSLEGLLRPERVEVATGRALVLRTFHISRFGTIAGCRVLNGTIERSHRVHVIRDQTVLNHYSIASLKREKDDAKEVREGMECGIRLDGFNDVKEGDLLESFRIDEVKRTLD